MIFIAPSAQAGTQIPQPLHFFSSIFTIFLVVFTASPCLLQLWLSRILFRYFPSIAAIVLHRGIAGPTHTMICRTAFFPGRPWYRISGTLCVFHQKRFQLLRRNLST
jgi:hypothetical protein